MDRKFEAKVVRDNVISLIVDVPVPEDDLFKSAKFLASNRQLEPIHESFAFQTPRKVLSEPAPIVIYYPSVEAYSWVIFKFFLQSEGAKELPRLTADANLKNKLFAKK